MPLATSGKFSQTKFVNSEGNVTTLDVNDAASSHYLGKLNSDETPTTVSITLNGGTVVTAKANDWVTLKTKPIAYIWNGAVWNQFSSETELPETTKMSVVNGINTAAPTAAAPSGNPITYYSYDSTNEQLTLFQMASGSTRIKSEIYVPNTWSTKSWTGLSSFYASYIWTDGENIYYSYPSRVSSGDNYVLNKSTSTWSTKSWNGLTNFSGSGIWTDGTNIYYSGGSDQYVLDKSTSTWSTKSWSGLTNFSGDRIWTDGDNIYYSYDSTQYVLDKSTSTWSEKTWNGLTNFSGGNIWTDGENIYYSSGSSNQKVLE